MSAVEPRYRFAGSAGALWLGLPPLPLLTLGLAVSATVAALYVGAPLPVGAALLAVGAGVAFVPVAGRAAVEWLPSSRRHVQDVTCGAAKWSSSPVSQPRDGTNGWALRLPREYGRLTLRDHEGIAVIDDPAARASTVVLAVAGTDRFPLLDAPEQARLLAAWGDTIAALASDPRLRRLQWVERAGPERRDLGRWLASRADDTNEGAVEDYAAMTASIAATAVHHDVWLALSYARPRNRREDDIAPAVRDSLRGLLMGDLAARPLAVDECAGLLRHFSEPDVHLRANLVDGDQVGPASQLRRWDHLRTDDCFHRSFSLAGWPRIPVSPGWLEPLLLATPPGVTRTVSVHLAPVAQAAAVRQARAARSRARLDVADRARLGFADTASANAAAEEAVAAEEELVAGYRLTRMSGVVTCSAPSLTELDEACRSVRTAAAAARLDVRACHGEHHLGFLASLPLCRPAGRPR